MESLQNYSLIVDMGLDQTLITGVVLVIVIALFMVFMDYLIPLYDQYQFHEICRAYVFLAESTNGLSLAHQNQLVADLQEKGIHVLELQIDAEGSVKRLDKIEFKVRGEISINGFRSLFEREKRRMELFFETSQVARRVVP